MHFVTAPFLSLSEPFVDPVAFSWEHGYGQVHRFFCGFIVEEDLHALSASSRFGEVGCALEEFGEASCVDAEYGIGNGAQAGT